MSTLRPINEERRHRAKVFYDMAQQGGNGRFGLPALYAMLVEQAAQLAGCEQSGLLLWNDERSVLLLAAGQQPHTSQLGAEFSVSQGILGQVYDAKRPFMVPNYDEWSGRLLLPSLSPVGRMLAVPIHLGDSFIGILTVQDAAAGDFSEQQVEDLALFAAQTAVLIENAQLHERLQQNQEHLQHIITAAPDAMFICDASQTIVQVNRVACTLFGYTEEELVGQPIGMLLSPNRRKAHAAYINRFDGAEESVRPMRPVHGQPYGLKANGDLIPIETTISKTAVYGESYYTAIVRDVTERLKIEHEMRLSQKMESLGLVASGVAHDFNNLLNAILIQNDLARLKLSEDSPACVHLKNSDSIVHQAASITEQLLSYAGSDEYETVPLSLNSLIVKNVTFLEVSLSSSIHLKLALTDESVQIDAESGQMQQVVMNLIINAADAYAGGSGEITIKTERIYLDGARQLPQMNQPFDAGWYVTLDVIDQGGGIADELRDKIFDPFFTTKAMGRGLGLAAVRGIVQGHGGHIWVDSAVGDGTTFHLIFPVAAEVEEAEEAKEVEEVEEVEKGDEDKRPFADDTTPAILLVEDEEGIRGAMAEFLRRSGFVVMTAENGRLAIDLYEQQPERYALVILDLSLPVLHGRYVLEHVRRKNPTLPIILLSGYNQDAALEGIDNVTNCIFVQKPFNMHQLVEKSRELVGVRI